jgi:hypothetical protein
MRSLETLNIIKIRMQLATTCQKMIQIAKKPGKAKGYHIYDYSDPQYIALSFERDRLGKLLVEEWNKH